MKSHIKPYFLAITILLAICSANVMAQEKANPFLGFWSFTTPEGGPGWLGVMQENGILDASMLWRWGSVYPVNNVYMNGDELVFTNLRGVIIKKDKEGKPIRGHDITTTFRAKINGEKIEFVKEDPNDKGTKVTVEKFSGQRIPPLPPKPDLTKVKV